MLKCKALLFLYEISVFRNINMVNVRVIFCLFFNCWRLVAKRGYRLSGLQVTIATSYIFNMLRLEWEINNWDINELKYLTSAMDTLPDKLNSILFLNC